MTFGVSKFYLSRVLSKADKGALSGKEIEESHLDELGQGNNDPKEEFVLAFCSSSSEEEAYYECDEPFLEEEQDEKHQDLQLA